MDKLRFNLIKAWAKDCDEHGCRPRRHGKLPKRLLKITGTVEEPKIRLFCTAENATGSYVALSYTWGRRELYERWDDLDPSDPNRKTYRTTSADYDHFLTDIPFDRLPITLKDAVKLTLGVDVPYLWVDSFCIIQNSPADMTKSPLWRACTATPTLQLQLLEQSTWTTDSSKVIHRLGRAFQCGRAAARTTSFARV
jgi:hypothetical protein